VVERKGGASLLSSTFLVVVMNMSRTPAGEEGASTFISPHTGTASLPALP
jgi:hypothetical protein